MFNQDNALKLNKTQIKFEYDHSIGKKKDFFLKFH